MLKLIFFIAATLFMIFFTAAVLFSIYGRKIAFNQKVDSYFNIKSLENDREEVKVKNKKQRTLFGKYWDMWVERLGKKTSQSERKKLETLIRDAGYTMKFSAVEFRLIQLIITIGVMLLVLFIFPPFVDKKLMVLFLAIAVGFLGYQLPLFFLSKKRTVRIKQIDKDMPDFFDTVNLLLEAGVGLDAAISTVCQKKKSPLSEEFMLALEDMKRGKSRRDAFYDLRRRVPSHSLQSALTSLIQADQLGVGMAKVIMSLTTRIREQRLEVAREQAMKAPVKMLFPMVFFIFPSLFIVILGPVAVKVITGGLFG